MRSRSATAARAPSGTSPARRSSPARPHSAHTAHSARSSPSRRRARPSSTTPSSSRESRAPIGSPSAPTAWTPTRGRTTRPPPACRHRCGAWKAATSRTRSSWSMAPALPARCRWMSARPTRTTSPRRRRSAPTAACGSPCFPRLRSTAPTASLKASACRARDAGFLRSCP